MVNAIQATQGSQNPFYTKQVEQQKVNTLQQKVNLFSTEITTEKAKEQKNPEDKVSFTQCENKIKQITAEKTKIEAEIAQIQALTNSNQN